MVGPLRKKKICFVLDWGQNKKSFFSGPANKALTPPPLPSLVATFLGGFFKNFKKNFFFPPPPY